MYLHKIVPLTVRIMDLRRKLGYTNVDARVCVCVRAQTDSRQSTIKTTDMQCTCTHMQMKFTATFINSVTILLYR